MIHFYKREKRRLIEIQEPEPGCWINLSPPYAPDELADFASQFEIDPAYLTDALDIDERARYERDEDLRFIILTTPILNENAEMENEAIFMTVPIGIILTIEHVITVSAFETPILEYFTENKVRNIDPANEKQFVLQIFEQNVYRFLSSLKQLNLRRNRIEKELIHSNRNSELKQLLAIEKSLVYFVNSLNANELLKMKMKRTDFLHINGDEDLTDLFEDIIIDNSQALSMANVYTNILNGTMDAYSSIISNNLNQVIHRLTIVTVILMVPTVVASFFGMNIQNGLPDTWQMFLGVVFFTAALTGGLYWFLLRRKFF